MSRGTTSRWAATAVTALLLAVIHPLPARAAPTWLAPMPLSDPAALVNYEPTVVLDAQGNATAAWTTNVTTPVFHNVVMSAYRPVGGTWSAPVQISAPVDEATNSESADLGVAADGTVTAVWSIGKNSGPFSVKASSRPPGGAWSDPATLLTGHPPFSRSPRSPWIPPATPRRCGGASRAARTCSRPARGRPARQPGPRPSPWTRTPVSTRWRSVPTAPSWPCGR